jgi:CDP-glucose 4,6-dehydratase
MMLAQRLTVDGAGWAAGAWNFGPEDADTQPVSWIADRLVREWGEGASWTDDGGDHPHEAAWLKLDCSKARQQLGWKPRWHLSQALAAIVEWHQAHGRGEDMREVSLRQIEAYERSINS